MNARGQIAAALGASFVMLFLAQGWILDVQRWVLSVTARDGGTPPDARKPDSGFAPGAGAGGRDAGGGGGGQAW